MKISHLIALMAMAILTTSCIINTAKKDSNQAAKKAIKTIGAPESWATKAEKYGDDPAKWVDSFDDPVMLKLIKEGKANNLNLQVTAANMDKAWLLAEQSGAVLKPIANLSFGQSGAGTGLTGGSTSSQGKFNVGLTVSWELDVWGRLQAGVDAATASAQAAKADYLYAQQSLSASIVKSYLKVIETKQQTGITQKNKLIFTKMMQITQAKYDNGISSAQDIAVNKANLSSIEAQLISLEGSQRDALRALEVLLGRYPDATIDIPDVLPKLPPPPPAGIPSELLERRPDIVSAERKIAAAYDATYQAKTARLPQFSLTSTLSGSSSSLSEALNPANMIWQLASNIVTPLLDGGKRKIDVKIANVEQKQAVSAYVQTALTAFLDVESSLDQSRTLASRETALSEVLAESNQAYKLAILRYKEGEIGLLDTLQIQQQAISAESNLLSIHRLQLEQRINLYLSLGGSWSSK